MDNYICKIANLDELKEKCDYEINRHPGNKIWKEFKERAIKNYIDENSITYIGILNNQIIYEATAIIKEDGFKGDIEDYSLLFGKNIAYLSGFRTNKEFAGKGYFSRLYQFMEKDLHSKGYSRFTLDVKSRNVRSMQIYFGLGFNIYLKSKILSLEEGKSNVFKEIVNYYMNEVKISRETTKEDKLFDYVEVPSYLKTSKKSYKNKDKDDYEISL